MGILARAVIYGFGFSLGAALFKRVSEELHLDDDREQRQARSREKASDSAPPPEPSDA